jgi:hypothetical protein
MKHDIHRHSDLSYGGEDSVMKPQLIQHLHTQEMSAVKYYTTGRKNKLMLRVFDFNDSFFITCTIKQSIILAIITEQNSTHKMQNKAVCWNKQNTMPPSQESCWKDNRL